MKKLTLIALPLLYSAIASSSVWTDHNQWSQEYEESYGKWIESEIVHTTMFTDKSSKYYGIKVDCADVTYALRAIFSYENKLEYKVRNPIYKSGHKYKYYGNSINKFDKYTKGMPRLVRYVNFLGDSLGSETLTYFDSYSAKIDKLSSGSIFTYKYKQASGKYLRHVFNIKKVDEFGNFNMIWSNQQRKKNGSPMKYAEAFPVKHKPDKLQWGFKRFKWPSHFNKTEVKLNDLEGNEQHDLSKRLSEKDFFKSVKDTLKIYDEGENSVVLKQLRLLCNQAKDRVGAVLDSITYQKKINNRCMDYTEFDEYSTPSRDGRLKGMFDNLATIYTDMVNSGADSRLAPKNTTLVTAIINMDNVTFTDLEEVNEFCSFKYSKTSVKINLADIYSRMKKGLVSTHPNDNLERRWGRTTGKKTNCKAFY
jgi:hypothetical protein